MDTRRECLDHLFRFVQSGNIDEAAVAGGTILAYLATLEGKTVQLAALARLREDLTKRLEKSGVSEDAEDRHIAIEDALAKAHATLQKSSGGSLSPGKAALRLDGFQIAWRAQGRDRARKLWTSSSRGEPCVQTHCVCEGFLCPYRFRPLDLHCPDRPATQFLTTR